MQNLSTTISSERNRIFEEHENVHGEEKAKVFGECLLEDNHEVAPAKAVNDPGRRGFLLGFHICQSATY